MALEYRTERNAYMEKLINKLIDESPEYVNAFYQHMHNGRREIATQMSYIRDVVDFIKYEKSVLSQFNDVPLKDIPVSLFGTIKLQDLNEYRDYLKSGRQLANASAKKHFASISAFYKFLNMFEYTQNNPMRDFEFPVVNKRRLVRLDSSLSNQLLAGILANDKYLIKTNDDGPRVVDIDESVKIKREKLVLRNYAICCLFLGTGLRVSELVGLDMSDVDFRQNSLTVVAKGGDEIQVFFGNDVAAALKEYMFGIMLPQDIIRKYHYTEKNVVQWAKLHAADDQFEQHLEEDFGDFCTPTFKRDMTKIRYSLLRQGRTALMPKRGCDAVFITTRGTRMSVRSVELMIKEMVQTYLPDYADKDKFSPHKLRATCATRILTQTGDINLASTQLNHKGISVTAEFYAQITKEKHKEQISKLDINNW